MIQKRVFLLLVLFSLGAFGTVLNAQQLPALKREDAKAWERKVWVGGHIRFTDHPTLGRTPAAGEVIAFRRTGRNNYVVAVRANADGRYEVFLDPGRYKIIVPGLNADRTGFVDLLATGQPRYVDVVRKYPSGVQFDVELRSPR